MKTLLLSFLLLFAVAAGAQTYTSFYCNAGAGLGTNINSGSTPDSTNNYVSLAGNWDNASLTFTPTDGGFPVNSNIAVGDWAMVVIAGVTNPGAYSGAGYLAKISTINSGANGTIVLSSLAKSGTAPASQTGTAELRVGGAWSGPYGSASIVTISFPFSFIANTATNGPDNIPRVNFKNNAMYSVYAPLTHNLAGPIVFQGYSTSPGDYGRAKIDGTKTGTAYVLFTQSGSGVKLVDLDFGNNGTTSSGDGVLLSGVTYMQRCVVHNILNRGIRAETSGSVLDTCEAYSCNTGNTTGHYAISLGAAGVTLINCVAHDNAGTANIGFLISSGGALINCLSYNNGRDGFYSLANGSCVVFSHCAAYNNRSNALEITAATYPLISDCQFLKQGQAGITNSGTSTFFGTARNNGFGAGTMANAGGDFAPSGLRGLEQTNNFSYASGESPWVDVANTNFTISATSSGRANGYGYFLKNGIYSPILTSYPDVGITQQASTNSTASSSSGSYSFAQ